jgi:uncharacterized protein (DUF433 family)
MAMQELSPGVISDPEILGGRPIIKGHRITVSQIIGHFAAGDTIEEIRDAYDLTESEIRAALRYAEESVRAREATYVVSP